MYRLGLDVGTNSIGWCLFDISNIIEDFPVFIDGGVRLFSDGRNPKDNEPINVVRRTARGIRKNNDRKKSRYMNLVNFFRKHGFITKDNKNDIFTLNPYKARSNALDSLDTINMVRGILHIGKRRGFQSNRKEASDKDGGKTKDAMENLKITCGNKNLGQHLYEKYTNNPFGKTRFAPDVKIEFYPNRDMYKNEFNAIKSNHYNALPQEQWEKVYNIIFHQRPLKAQPKGKCRFETNEYRIYKADPLFQKFRMYQEINSLEYISKSNYKGSQQLSDEQRLAIIDKLQSTKEPKFSAFRKIKNKNKELLFADDIIFNLEESKNQKTREKLNGLATDISFADEKCFGKTWFNLTDDDRSNIVNACLDTENNHELQNILIKNYRLSKEQAENCANVTLEKGIGSVSIKFIKKILPFLEQGLKYHDAVKQAGYISHSDFNTGEVFEFLPYYGKILEGSTVKPKITPNTPADEAEYGKVTNVTVHVALNQIRKLVNEIIKEYGVSKITEIIVEVTRDLGKSREELNKIKSEQTKNRTENEKINEILKTEFNIPNPSYNDRLKYKLWLELSKDGLTPKCIFSGKNIGHSDLFNGTVEVEHIFPLSRTYDDSFANKTLAFKEANHFKGNRSPHEAFGNRTGDDYAWDKIFDRARILPPKKRWRFDKGAIEKFLADNDKGDFIARQLTDTAYIARATRQYLTAICSPYKIWVTPGRLTSVLRHQWGLNHFISDDGTKDRQDNRHHLIDAFVIGLTERGIIQKISTLTARNFDLGKDKFKMPELPISLKTAFKDCFDSVIISNRPDRSHGGCFFKETAYGVLDKADPDFKPDYTLVTRKAITALSVKELSAIRDTHHRNKILDLCSDLFDDKGKISNEKELKNRLTQYSNDNTIKRLRILVSKGNAKEIIHGKNKEHKKAYMLDGFSFCDIYQVEVIKNDKPTGKFDYIGHYVPPIDAIKIKGTKQEIGQANDSLTKEFKLSLNRHEYNRTTAKKLMRLYKNDTVSMIENGKLEYWKINGFSSTDNKIMIQPLNRPIFVMKKNKLGKIELKEKVISPVIPALIEKQLKPITLTITGRVKAHGTHTNRRTG